jgi:multiple sugar transport system ATP-binding protein
MNLVGADLERDNASLFVRFGEHRVRLDDGVLSSRPALEAFEGKPLILGIRPEDLEDAALAGEAPPDRVLSALVDIREDMGSEVFVHFGSGGRPVRGEDVAAAIGEEAIEATEQQTKGKGSLFVARVSRESRAREGEQANLLVTTSQLHFFDPETGHGIYDGGTS